MKDTEHKGQELLPCPFCGATPSAKNIHYATDRSLCFAVFCECNAVGPSGETENSKDDAVTAWNRRAPAVPVPQGWKPVAELCAQMCDSRAASLLLGGQNTAGCEARKCASVLRNPPDAWREKLESAAPQPPEAAPGCKPLTVQQYKDLHHALFMELGRKPLTDEMALCRAIERAHGIE